MIKKLRRKFVIILMSIVTLIIAAVIMMVFITVRINIERSTMMVLNQELEDRRFFSDVQPSPDEGKKIVRIYSDLRMPTLVLNIDGDGKISVAKNQIHFIEDAQIQEIVSLALAGKTEAGVLNNYRLRYLVKDYDDQIRIAFCDTSMERNMTTFLVLNSLLIGGIALLVFFVISIFLSRWAVRPVEAAWERQRQFVADASHELKTPLTVILSNADMIIANQPAFEEKNVRRMDHIKAESIRMKHLVEDMLTLARADSMNVSAVFSDVNFSDLVTNTILMFEAAIYDGGKRLEYEIQDDQHVLGAPEKLRQLIGILLDNAQKFCSDNGLILVTLAEYGKKSVCLTVENEGEPIPQEELALIFQRFYRIDKARSNNGGFGLGLSIAQNITLEHKGKIWAELDEKGNVFKIVLPLI